MTEVNQSIKNKHTVFTWLNAAPQIVAAFE